MMSWPDNPYPEPRKMPDEERIAKLEHLVRLLVLERNGRSTNYGHVRIADLRSELGI